jgi:hypothetical protein
MTTLDRTFWIGGAGALRRLGVIACVYAAHAVFALAVAWPPTKVLADPTLAYPRRDHVLFEPGGLFLTEALRLARDPLTSLAEGSSFGILVGLYLGLLPLAALLHALGTRERISAPELAAAAARAFAPLSLLLGGALVVAGLASLVPLATGSLLETKLGDMLGERGSDLASLGFRAAALLAVGVVGVVHDLARAAIVVRATTALRGARCGLVAFRAWPAEALGGWALRVIAGILVVTIAARVTTNIGIETATNLAAVALVHQSVVFLLVFLRADWLAMAVQLVERSYTRDR